jgi:hypothetical protein
MPPAAALQRTVINYLMLRIIPTKLHGILDYLFGILLIALPTLLGFSSQENETWVMIVLGIVTILYSMVTRYECAFVSLISMRTHLWFDLISGILLIWSPWLLHFAGRVYLPHVIVGAVEIVIVLLSDNQPVKSPSPRLAPKDPA